VIRIREALDHLHSLELVEQIADGLLRERDLRDEVREPDTQVERRGVAHRQQARKDLHLRRPQRREAQAMQALRELRLEVVLRDVEQCAKITGGSAFGLRHWTKKRRAWS